MSELENGLLPILTVDRGFITTCNDVFFEQVGLCQSDLVGTPLENILTLDANDDHSYASITQLFHAANQTESGVFATATIKNNYHYAIPIQLHCQTTERVEGAYRLCFRILENRSIDPITGLPNGWAIHSRSDYLLVSPENVRNNFVLVFFNIDNFSTINFRYGFDSGDDYLWILARKIKECVGQDNVVARFNNAKFGILIENRQELSQEDFKTHLKHICLTLCQTFEKPLVLGNGKRVTKSCSIGVSEQSFRYSSFHAMEIAAETAMLEAKKYSASRYCFSTSKRSIDILSHKLIIDEFPNAIEYNKINIYFQPQYELATDKLSGFEALSRWHHDALGHIAPDVFVRIAEDIGLHLEFDLWVVDQVCSQIVRWQNKGVLTPQIAINISVKTLEMTNFVERLTAIVNHTQCPTELIEFEITETASVNNFVVVNENLNQIKALGISLAIDDFGAGYSSLSSIKRFHHLLDKVKLDRSLIHNICNTDIDREFARQIITLSKILKVKIVAEGVEEKEQKDLINSLGCDYAQGYYFDKAISAEAAEQLIKNKTT